jgi:hypothetical protein
MEIEEGKEIELTLQLPGDEPSEVTSSVMMESGDNEALREEEAASSNGSSAEDRRKWEVFEPGKRFTSHWWKYFKQYAPQKKFRGCVCKLCHDKYVGDLTVSPTIWEVKYGGDGTSTSKLSQHVEAHHKPLYNEITQNEVLEAVANKKRKCTSGPMDNFAVETLTNQDIFLENVMKFLVFNNLPLMLVEQESFRNLVKGLHKVNVNISRRFVTNCITKKEIELKIERFETRI